MITNHQENLDDSPQLIKILVLMMACFNLFGVFLLFNPRVFDGADAEMVDAR